MTQPRTPVIGGNGGRDKKGGKGALIAVGAIVTVGLIGGVGYGTYALLTRDGGSSGGAVIVGPF